MLLAFEAGNYEIVKELLHSVTNTWVLTRSSRMSVLTYPGAVTMIVDGKNAFEPKRPTHRSSQMDEKCHFWPFLAIFDLISRLPSQY